MGTINKSVEATKVTYSATSDTGPVSIVVYKAEDGTLHYDVAYSGGAGLPTWSEFCTDVEKGSTVNIV